MKKQWHRSGNAHTFNRHRWCSAWVREMGELEVVRGQRVEPSQLLLRRSGSLLGSWQEARGFRVQEWTARFPFLFSFLWHAMGSIGLWIGLDLYSVLYNLFCSWRFPWAQTFITLVASICEVWGAWKVGWCEDTASFFFSRVLYHFFSPFLNFTSLGFSSLCVYLYVMKLLLACASYKGERSGA